MKIIEHNGIIYESPSVKVVEVKLRTIILNNSSMTEVDGGDGGFEEVDDNEK